MISFERLTDAETVRSIATHPKVYPHVSDDFSPSPSDWVPPMVESVIHLGFIADGYLQGMFTLVPQNGVCYEVHTCLLPCAWGASAGEAAKLAVEWMFANTRCKRIVTTVPAYNRLALRFAQRAGMTEYGFNPDSYQKGGVMYGQHLLGVSKCL